MELPPPPLSEDWVLAPAHVQLSTLCPVQILRHQHAVEFRRHSHAYTELVMVQSGTIPHEIFGNGEKQSQVIQDGDFLIVPPGLAHGYGAVKDLRECRRIDICYLAEWFLWDLDLLWKEGLVPLFFASHLFRRTENLQIWKFKLSAEELVSCENELNDIAAEYRQPTPSLLFVRSTFFKFLVIVARVWRRQTPQGDLYFRPEVWSALQAVDRFIKKGENLRIDALAREMGLTPKTFSRLFETATGLLPSEYFRHRRTQHAAHLLLESDMTIGEIAARLGYYDAAHLSRSFLQNERMTPRDFRRRFRAAA